jgi:thioredoxin 2
VCERFGVKEIATLLVLRHGTVVARQTGASPEAVLAAWLDGAPRDADRSPRSW